MLRPLVPTAAVLVLAFVAAPAHAEIAPREEVVRYGDLDLTGEDGAQVLLRRLEQAAERVCSVGNVSFRDHRAVRQARACKEETLSKAVARIDAPLVQNLFAARRQGNLTLANLK